jgi:hypothetical protein
MDQSNIELAIAHWPFVVVAAVLAVMGRVAESVFTRERAYRTPKKDFWFWMRETMPAHPIIVGLLLGCVMPDPEGGNWRRGLIIAYFGGAGAAGLAGWIYLRANAKTIPLPGQSGRPTAR